MTISYDKIAAGERLREKRTLLGYTQEEMAEKIDRVPKYYADIERGNCGMSIETMLSLADTLNMSLDYIVYGKDANSEENKYSAEANAILEIVDKFSEKQQKGMLRMLHIFMETWDITSK